jgi:predicted DNA-binding antitoxin AbrB/MazE fold protein
MTTTVDAIYENGMFRPTEPVSAPEGTRAKVTMPLDEAPLGNEDQHPNETPYEIMQRIAALYDEDGDPYVGWTHDEILYGRDGKGAR